jgi:hypothetical protein
MDPGFRYGGEALFFIGVAARIISWLIRTSAEAHVSDFSKPTTLSSLLSPQPATMSSEQQARVMAMIADPPRVVDHRCPKCGTLIHADIVHGGFGPCRKCGWSPSSPAAAAS